MPADDEGALTRRALLLGGLGGLGTLAAAGGVGLYVERNNPTVRRLLGGCGSTPAVPPSHYTITTGSFDSLWMRGSVPWAVALPPGHMSLDGTPVVICLSGLGEGVDGVLTGVGLPGWASSLSAGLALAIPGGAGDYYWHPRADGHNPLRWALDEFLPMVEQRFHVGGARNKRGTIGWSMGGFGALLMAQQGPELFSAAVGMSPAVFPSYDAARSGHPYTFDSAGDWEQYGLWDHLDELRRTDVQVVCGDSDPFAPTARQLLKRIPGFTGQITSGCHDKGFWRRSARDALGFLATNLGATFY